jgi:NitT/TauT family transport system substrate-binding protein
MVASAAPYSYDPELRAASRVLFNDVDAFGPIQLTSWQARTPFIEKNRAALVDLLEDTIRSIRWWIDPKNHTEVVGLVASFNKQKPENIDWIFTKHDLYRDPDWLPNLNALQSNVDSEREIGLLKTHIEINKYADLSLVKEAAARVNK